MRKGQRRRSLSPPSKAVCLSDPVSFPLALSGDVTASRLRLVKEILWRFAGLAFAHAGLMGECHLSRSRTGLIACRLAGIDARYLRLSIDPTSPGPVDMRADCETLAAAIDVCYLRYFRPDLLQVRISARDPNRSAPGKLAKNRR